MIQKTLILLDETIIKFVILIIFVVVVVKAFLVQNVKTLHEYKGHADNFICSVIPGAPFSSSQYTPGFYILPPSSFTNLHLWSSNYFVMLDFSETI